MKARILHHLNSQHQFHPCRPHPQEFHKIPREHESWILVNPPPCQYLEIGVKLQGPSHHPLP